MARIILVNGPFSSGKTEIANIIFERMDTSEPVLRLADGPHLVKIIRDEAHGLQGRELSLSHFHFWNKEKPEDYHSHSDGQPHFPFTVIKENIGAEMFRRIGGELSTLLGGDSTIVLELGTGRNGGRGVSRSDFSTETFLRVMQDVGLLEEFKVNLAVVVAVEAEWETRIRRNLSRGNAADGITESWGMQVEGLGITRESDFKPWERLGIEMIPFTNNTDGSGEMTGFVEQQVLPIIIQEGRLRGKESF